MKEQAYTCSMCGHSFDPREHAACNSCPLNKGCALICCPVCGYETVDPTRSTLAKAAEAFFARLKRQNVEGKV